jgi:hypothetical protein
LNSDCWSTTHGDFTALLRRLRNYLLSGTTTNKPAAWATWQLPQRLDNPINVLAGFVPADWAGAGSLALPVGSLLVKNDNQFAYLALDLTGDNGNSPGTSDYWRLTFDVDRNRAITPHVDINYGIFPTLPIRIGRQYYLGAGSWTGLQPPPSLAEAHQIFGASPASATPDRIWLIRIPLAEIGVTLGSLPISLPFGVRVESSTPAFNDDSPAGFASSFANLHDLLFALGPSDPFGGLAGVMMSGVGNIPATTIDAGGRATTAPTYVPHVQSAAFTGILNVLGNNVTLNSLWSSGARKYRILHRLGAAGPFANFRQGWTNYHWTGATSVLESFGPDASDMYPLPNPADDYSIQKLLLQWNTLGAVNGIHQFPGGVLQSSKCARCLPSADSDTTDRQRCAGRSDRRPTLQGTRHRALRHVNITAPPAPVQIHIKAFDAPGDLYSYNVTA